MVSVKSKLNPFRLATLLRVAISIAMVAFFSVESAQSDAAAVSPRGTYQGVTSQGLPGYIRTSNDGFLVRKVSIPIEVKCSSGSFVVPEDFEVVPIMPWGKFKETAEGSFLEEGVSMRVYASLSGRFNRRGTRVVTKSRIHLNARAPDGSTDTCDSGVVTMHAHK